MDDLEARSAHTKDLVSSGVNIHNTAVMDGKQMKISLYEIMSTMMLINMVSAQKVFSLTLAI